MKFIAKKEAMTQVFDKDGNAVACTILVAQPNFISQVKTIDKDGYNAIQLASVEKKEKHTNKPQIGHFRKAKLKPQRMMVEVLVNDPASFQVGQEIKVDTFKEGEKIDVSGKSKGKGFQGVMKLHGFAGGPAAHGSGFHRHAGSTGMRSTPGRCFKGGKRASRMGGDKITVQNLEILEIHAEKNRIVVKGAVPGSNGSYILLSKAKKIKKNHK